jgi:hypothetical protein
MTTYQSAEAKALEMIGMKLEDTERTDFFRRSGVKAGKVLRSMGYSRERFPTSGGRANIQWAEPAAPGEYRPPAAMDHVPAFSVLVGVLVRNG